MSHSQFHSTNSFILRHAWLNLWDKHMTTGRINQVTIVHQQRRSAVAEPPKERNCTKKGIAEAIPIAYCECAQGAIAADDLFICPHWVPQDVVRREAWSALPPITSPQHIRLKRRKPTSPHAHEARIGGATVPKDLVKFLAKPSIHRPRIGARSWKWAGLQASSAGKGAVPEHRFNI